MKFIMQNQGNNEGSERKEKPVQPGSAQTPESAQHRTKLNEIGADMKSFIENFEKVDTKEKQEWLKKANEWDQKGMVEELRRAGVDAEKNQKDPNLKHKMLASLFLTRNTNAAGKMSFTVDFGSNQTALDKVGAGDIFEPTVKAIRVKYADGKVIDRAVRTINPSTGRIGYYEESSLKQGLYIYVPVFNKTEVEILETQPGESLDIQRQRLREHMEIYNPPNRRDDMPEAHQEEAKARAKQLGIPKSNQSVPNSPKFIVIEGKSYPRVDRTFWENPQLNYRKYLSNKDPLGSVDKYGRRTLKKTFMGKEIASTTNDLIYPYLIEVQERAKAAGIEYDVDDIQCHNERNIEGTNRTSNHTYGIAFDINPRKNPKNVKYDKLDPATRIPPELLNIFRSLGFRCGADFDDSMHVEFLLDPLDPQSKSLLTTPLAQTYRSKFIDPVQQPVPVQPERPVAKSSKDAQGNPVSTGPMKIETPEGEYYPKLNAQVHEKIDQLYGPIIERAAAKYDVPANLIRALILQESGGNRYIASGKAAGGLTQFIESTAHQYGMPNTYPSIQKINAKGKPYYVLDPRDDRADPEKCIDACAHLLADNLRRYNGSVVLALAAYNAGDGAVKKYGGVPPFAETQGYVRIIPRTFASLNAEEKAKKRGGTGTTGGNPDRAIS